ncbi:amidase domain-containing protein [Oceanobacillus saliphilus]|uniref:amidase domain-containing protein n=1 Tax=Oceanobacillus saliphilus TaxID=2925834 RepID=UPI00201DFC52|nr:amidase domain-containing protein [Oceanobacillus saliphilus]
MEKIKMLWLDFFHDREKENWWQRKQNLCSERGAEIIQIRGNGKVFEKLRYDKETHYRYFMHLTYVIKQHKKIYVEEHVLPYGFGLVDGTIKDHKPIKTKNERMRKEAIVTNKVRDQVNERFAYDRLAAVQYAERWWNSYNPAYRFFDVDCTNYVSQCLRAGGGPMWGSPVRERGWWYGSGTWSFSWSVAHSLRWYLSGSEQGLKGREMERADQLIPGDIICYDFQGDGRWDHNTIVVAKDTEGMPLVNAHTDNSRNRYWSYEDSTAWTPNIQYKFFRIGDD